MKKLFTLMMVLSTMISMVACAGDMTRIAGENHTPTITSEIENKRESVNVECNVSDIVDTTAMPYIKHGDGRNADNDGDRSTGKIAIITAVFELHEESYQSAQAIVNKYPGRVIHETWSYEHLDPPIDWSDFTLLAEKLIEAFERVAANSEVKAVVINLTDSWVVDSVEKLLELRDDLLIIFCSTNENPADESRVADLIIQHRNINQGAAIARQAHAMGAKTFVHYSFGRHWANPYISTWRNALREECERLGMELVFVDLPVPHAEIPAVQLNILQNVPRKVTYYGMDTAFYINICALQSALIMACIEQGAIFPSPCCPPPFHGFPAALQLDGFSFTNRISPHFVDVLFDEVFDNPEQMADIEFIKATIGQINEIVVDAGMGGRFSTWPFPRDVLDTFVAVDYAFRWMAGETNGRVDIDVLRELIESYTGPGAVIELLEEDGVVYDNYILYMQPYITFR